MTAQLTDDQVTVLIDHLKSSEAIELKVTVPDSDIRSTVDRLGLDPLNGELRQVVFFDTPDLSLNQAGLVVRARRIQGGGGDTVVKLRPVDPAELPLEIRESDNSKIEIDVMPRGFVCSASMKGKSSAADIRSVILGESKIKSLFTKEQRDFYRARAPEGLKLSSLTVLGPLNTLRLTFSPDELNRKFVAELWLYPDGSRILELSTKATPENAFQVAAETRNYLQQHNVDLSADQQPKTSKVLKYFSALHKQVESREPALTAGENTRPA